MAFKTEHFNDRHFETSGVITLPISRNNITSFGDRILYHMSQSYPFVAADNPPKWRENWASILAVLEYYMLNGRRFT